MAPRFRIVHPALIREYLVILFLGRLAQVSSKYLFVGQTVFSKAQVAENCGSAYR
jgi:hypothetical protein